MEAYWEERRQFPRVTLKTPLRCQIRGKSEYSNVVTDDVSEGGVSFINDSFIPLNTQVNLEISLLSRILNAVGRVANVSSVSYADKYRLGIEFLELQDTQKLFLSDYIQLKKGL